MLDLNAIKISLGYGSKSGFTISAKEIKEIPIIYPTEYPILVNEETAKNLGVTIPEKYKKNKN